MSSKPSLINQFPVFATVFRSMELIDMVNAIPGRNLPVLNFAYYLLKKRALPFVYGKHATMDSSFKATKLIFLLVCKFVFG